MLNKKINTHKIKPNTKYIGKNVIYHKSVDSTNNIAKNTHCPNGTVFIAEEQTKGKGRMNRSWISGKKTSILMSIALMPRIPYECVSQITLVTGLAVCETLTELFNLPFKIKWPNDIVIDGKKICGILTEGIICTDGIKIINGIGINVNSKYFSDDICNKATSLYILRGKKTDRILILNKLLEKFEKYYEIFLKEGITNILNKYSEMCVTLNREIIILNKGEKTEEVAIGINHKGELMRKKQDGTTQSVNSGEVSVRGIYNY